MKKWLLLFSIFFFCLNLGQAGAQQPDYEKFGRIAISVVQEDYPGDPVKDYVYKGRKNVSENKVADTFQFTVADQGKQKQVLVTVIHQTDNDKVLSINVEEVQ
ncbi:hypothetical protein JOC86_002906 [Bacillus pakistanensis]|uniref:DUF3889 domain-containing protein n=1 Tax=Rossellomorea pakistanensis TaxID=992288 RepID=A0ABS2NF13_9BACI|nr:DUF3889 domain-containing protein [Bacillus pakistanensis]MBM7586354.1 hypothetical protein [Bacillus pakistanensis]